MAFVLTAGFLVFLSAAAFMLLVDTAPLSKSEYLETWGRLAAFKYTGLIELEGDDIRTLYRWTCTGRCHGAEPIETSRHTSREWQSIIERMRVKNGASVNLREQELITAYLLKHFGSNVPTILSPEANTYLKRYLWKSDFGESDLYVDLIYSPVEYFNLMGEALAVKRYEADRNLVFMVYINTHQGKLQPFPLQDMAVLKAPSGETIKPLDWKVLYESGDMHHIEGVLRFRQSFELKDGAMDVTLIDLPGQKERVFRWDLPIPRFDQVKADPAYTRH